MNKFLLSVSLLTMLLIGCEEGQTVLEESSSIEEVEVETVEAEEVEETNTAVEEVSAEVEPEPEPEAEQEDRIYFLTGDEKEYVSLVDSVMEIQSSTLQNVTSLVSEAKSNVELAKDESHLKTIEASYLQLKLTYSLLEEMTEKSITPKIFNDTHAYLSESVRLLLQTESYFVDGLKALDKETFDKGLSYLDESSVYFSEFNAEFNEVMKVYQ